MPNDQDHAHTITILAAATRTGLAREFIKNQIARGLLRTNSRGRILRADLNALIASSITSGTSEVDTKIHEIKVEGKLQGATSEPTEQSSDNRNRSGADRSAGENV